MIDEDWEVVKSLLPVDWWARAVRTQALKGLRQDKSAESLLRVLLIHLAGGYSLRETAQRARQAQLATISDVALLKRLRKSKNWLAAMCAALFRERTVGWSLEWGQKPVRLIDATTVQEPGATGSSWLVHYSLELPSLQCHYLKVTSAKGAGTGEGFQQHPIQAGDHVIADRGYANGPGLQYVAGQGGLVLVRFSPHNLKVWNEEGERMDWQSWLAGVTRSGEIQARRVWAGEPPGQGVWGRVCVVRKTLEAIERSHKRLRRRANQNGPRLRPETLVQAQFVMIFTTFPESDFPAPAILQWYRLRWQIELVFKRFKSIAQLSHLLKHDPESSKAWLYGKLLVALLAEKLHSQARAFSPWGCVFAQEADPEPLA